MCNCNGKIKRADISRTIWVGYHGEHIAGWKHNVCHKRLSEYQLLFKLEE